MKTGKIICTADRVKRNLINMNCQLVETIDNNEILKPLASVIADRLNAKIKAGYQNQH